MAKKSFTPHLNFYNRNVITKKLESENPILLFPYAGLCYASGWGRELNASLLDLFHPTLKDQEWLTCEGKSNGYWGSDSHSPEQGVFTDLRQTIVLFMAAMNNEL